MAKKVKYYDDDDVPLYGRKDNERDPLEIDCWDMGMRLVKKGDLRLGRARVFKGMNKRIVLVFLMRLAGFTTKQICPICKISPRTATRYVKLVYAKYPHLKNI